MDTQELPEELQAHIDIAAQIVQAEEDRLRRIIREELEKMKLELVKDVMEQLLQGIRAQTGGIVRKGMYTSNS